MHIKSESLVLLVQLDVPLYVFSAERTTGESPLKGDFEDVLPPW